MSKSILITHDELIADRERTNIAREEWMQTAVNVIHDKGPNWFLAQVITRSTLQYKDEKNQPTIDTLPLKTVFRIFP